MVDVKITLIDADDTLWLDSIYFSELRASVIEIAMGFSDDKTAIDQTVGVILREATAGEEGFRNAIARVSDNFGFEGPAKLRLSHAVERFRMHPVECLADAEAVIGELPGEKFLYTKGIVYEQIAKISRSGLSHLFSGVHIVQKKSRPVLAGVIQAHETEARTIVYIGNSIKNDIVPATQIGCHAIWLNHPDNTFGRDGTIPNGVPEAVSWLEVKRIMNAFR